MFDIGWSEILVIAIITVLVVGPKELPGLLRTVGKTVGSLRRMAGDFQNQFNDALREAELEDVKNTLNDARKLDPRKAVKDTVGKQLSVLDEAGKEVSRSVKESSDEINASLASKGTAKDTVAPVSDESAQTPQAAVEAPVEDAKTAPEPADTAEAPSPSADDNSRKTKE